MYQIKKMIGKKLLLPWSNLNVSVQDKNLARTIKTKILETSTKKSVILTAMCNQGVLFIIKNIDVFLALQAISYKELEESKCNNLSVVVIQYPKLTKAEIIEL
jgi:hypothetical protein